MSLLNFPPPAASGVPFALQEFNGTIISGNRDAFTTLQKSKFLSDYPCLERASLSRLQHSLSRDDVKGAFAYRKDADRREPNDRGMRREILRELDNTRQSDHGKGDGGAQPRDDDAGGVWQKGFMKMRSGLGGMLSRVMGGGSNGRDDDDTTATLLDQYADTINWPRAWLRVMTTARDGSRLAVVQATDYIRIYSIGIESRTPPLTLHHAAMRTVAAMQFDPSDSRILAVAGGSRVFVWRIINKGPASSKPTASLVSTVDTGISPLSSLVWDGAWGNSLIVASPASNKIGLVDLSTSEVSSIGAWTGGSVTGLFPSPDGSRIAVTYTGNVLRVYDRSTWRDEKWAGLAGRATGVVWHPKGEALLFATSSSSSIYSVAFRATAAVGAEGTQAITWVGSSRATPIFDCSAVEFDPTEGARDEDIERGDLRPVIRLGGSPRHLASPPDGERLVVTFTGEESSRTLAVFIVDWSVPSDVRLVPSGFIEASFLGSPDIVSFVPSFDAGALLAISWSSGSVQYVPLIYGKTPAATALSVHPLIEGSVAGSTIHEESVGWAEYSSLNRSVDLPSRLHGDSMRGGTEEEEEENGGRSPSPLCYTALLEKSRTAGEM